MFKNVAMGTSSVCFYSGICIPPSEPEPLCRSAPATDMLGKKGPRTFVSVNTFSLKTLPWARRRSLPFRHLHSAFKAKPICRRHLRLTCSERWVPAQFFSKHILFTTVATRTSSVCFIQASAFSLQSLIQSVVGVCD